MWFSFGFCLGVFFVVLWAGITGELDPYEEWKNNNE